MNPVPAPVIDEYIDSLLDKLHPDVAEKVRTKLDEDNRSFAQAVEEANPSKDPAYWAKKACNRCLGRGVSGTIAGHVNQALVGTKVKCACSARGYFKWLKAFRTDFNAKKAVAV